MREVMDKKGVTLAEISEATGLDVKTVWHATQDKKIRRSTRRAIANYLGESEADLFLVSNISDCINGSAV